jgi:hypothetical protein
LKATSFAYDLGARLLNDTRGTPLEFHSSFNLRDRIFKGKFAEAWECIAEWEPAFLQISKKPTKRHRGKNPPAEHAEGDGAPPAKRGRMDAEPEEASKDEDDEDEEEAEATAETAAAAAEVERLPRVGDCKWTADRLMRCVQRAHIEPPNEPFPPPWMKGINV